MNALKNSEALLKTNCSQKFVSANVAKQTLGASTSTLRRWAQQGFISTIRTNGGWYLYDVQSFLKNNSNEYIQSESSKSTAASSNQSDQSSEGSESHQTNLTVQNPNVCYCRVSSKKQRDDLLRQIESMQQQFPDYEVISDIGSGINWKRRGLRQIVDLTTTGKLKTVVVAYRDRLCRFAFELLEWIFQQHKVKLVVLNEAVEAESSDNQELAEDLLAIINVFNCRVNGKRKYKSAQQRSSDTIPDASKEKTQSQPCKKIKKTSAKQSQSNTTSLL